METEKKPGRPSRAEVLVRERRRRDTGEGQAKRLAVMGDLDRDAYDYRWINDSDARLMAKTQADDWDICGQDGGALKPDAADRDGAVRSLVGAKKDGSPLYAYLCRKPKELADIDRRKKDAALDEIEAQIKRGAPPKSNVDGAGFYNPSGENSIR